MADRLDRHDGHDTHDLERLVAFVDRELDATGMTEAAVQLARCVDCTRLADDLRRLATADRAMVTAPRPRDFRLTDADAVRLRMPAAEPVAVATRLVGEMHDTTHDQTLIAASLDEAITSDQRRTVDAWLTTCSACAGLRTDLVAIAAAHRTMPTPARPRDFRLDARDVARLRVGRWRDLLGWIGGSRDGFTRPLAAGLTTLGLVGVLISGAPAIWSGAATGAAPASAEDTSAGAAKSGLDGDPGDSIVFMGGENGSAAGPSASAAASGAIPNPEASSAPMVPGGIDASPNVAANGTEPSDRTSATGSLENQALTTGQDDLGSERQALESTAAQPSVGLWLSLIALVAGLATFVVRRLTRSLRGV